MGSGPGSVLNWSLPGVVVASLVIGLVYGAELRSTKPAVHARIGLGNEASRLEKASESGAAHR